MSNSSQGLEFERNVAMFDTAVYNIVHERRKMVQRRVAIQMHQCGNCCSGPEGYVWVNEQQITEIAAFIGKPVDQMKAEHTRPVGKRTSLKEFAGSGDCTFLHPQTRGCTIYPVRPPQCRTWPFWNSNLENPEAWQATEQVCPGAGNGNFFSIEEIEAQAAIIRL